MSPYEQFENIYFNTIKDETGAKYFISNEQKYRKFVFNDNEDELETKFRIKDFILSRELN